MVITLTYIAGPSLVQQIKRDREEEMIHRGTEYARAIQKFYKKNGRYPAGLDDLDKGEIRFLRKRYLDPLTKDGKWKLLHYGDIQLVPGIATGPITRSGTLTPGGAVIPGVPAPAGGSTAVRSPGFGTLQPQSQSPGLVIGLADNSSQASNPEAVPFESVSGDSTVGEHLQGNFGSDQQGGSVSQASGPGVSQPGDSSPFGQNNGGSNQVVGGGALVGVASVSKDKTIRIYNKKRTYDEWQFIYNPAQDQQKALLRGPYQPTTIGSSSIGIPAGQLNGQQQPGAPGQQNNEYGQQSRP